MTASRSTISYLKIPFLFTVAGILLGAWLGTLKGNALAGAVTGAFSCAVLGILEVSLSLDNAIVNAQVLKDMPEIWRARFLSWGLVIAVFGMRILFPLLVVAVAGRIGPVDALRMAVSDPAEYGRVLSRAHVAISAFGGSFLLMVAFSYFLDSDKVVHWVGFAEQRLSRLGAIEGIQIALVLVIMVAMSYVLPAEDTGTFVRCALFGLIAFVAVRGLGHLVEAPAGSLSAAERAGAMSFVYLEMLDASFSFDGVIGAFAISQDVFIIAIGLGIGASYVRGMTLMLVDRGTLAEYRFLEHGAFYAIMVLALIMYAQTRVDVPEAVTGLIGAGLIGVALVSSLLWIRSHPETVQEAVAANAWEEGKVSNVPAEVAPGTFRG